EVRAVRREMASWRFLSLEPSAMRAADSVDEVGPISATGAHVPAFLHRRERRDGSAVCDEVRRAVSALVDIRSLRVVPNGDFLELRARLGEGPELPARSLSDGTLRFLTLAALGVSDDIGLIALEEPENGIHPAKIEAMLGLLRSLSQPEEPEKPEEKNYSDSWSWLE
ncbi:MAG: AAA family ATPase, partial [Actinomyces dentalis]